jgi:hypothetical protein
MRAGCYEVPERYQAAEDWAQEEADIVRGT